MAVKEKSDLKLTSEWIRFIIYLLVSASLIFGLYNTLDKRITILESKSIDRKEFYDEMNKLKIFISNEIKEINNKSGGN